MSRFSRFGVLTALAAVVVVLQLTAQQPLPLKYDVHSETKVKGIIEALKWPATESKRAAAELELRSEAGLVEIYLCPKAFLTEMGVSFVKGDEIQVTGSKIKQANGELILAREVVKGSDTVVLRDDKGNPVWNWHH